MTTFQQDAATIAQVVRALKAAHDMEADGAAALNPHAFFAAMLCSGLVKQLDAWGQQDRATSAQSLGAALAKYAGDVRSLAPAERLRALQAMEPLLREVVGSDVA